MPKYERRPLRSLEELAQAHIQGKFPLHKIVQRHGKKAAIAAINQAAQINLMIMPTDKRAIAWTKRTDPIPPSAKWKNLF